MAIFTHEELNGQRMVGVVYDLGGDNAKVQNMFLAFTRIGSTS